jgi:hypothetical protein
MPRHLQLPGALRRRVGRLKPKRTFLVFCEGEKTEPQYLRAVKLHPNVHEVAAVDLRVESGQGGSVPLTLVERAVAARRDAELEDKEIDEFWCVFDVEWPRNHPHLSEAIDMAHANGIGLAVSNPCFELWLILHHCACTAWLDSAHAQRTRRDLDGSSGKDVDAARYMALAREAMARARALDGEHVKNGSVFPHNNPSSGMHLLLRAVGWPEGGPAS